MAEEHQKKSARDSVKSGAGFGMEKRKFIRLKAPIGLVYKLIKKNKRTQEQLSLVKDIGGGGLGFITREDLRVGDLLEIRIEIPHLEEPVRAIGEVAWCGTVKEKDRVVREAGVRFRDIEPRALNHVLEYVYMIGIG